MKKLILLISALLISACSNDVDTIDPIFCTTDVIVGIEITVKASNTGDVITDDIIVVINDGEYTETLQNNLNPNVYSGAYEREGSYVVTITGSNYQTYTSETIIVASDVCHVITEQREISIDPI